MVFVAKSLQQLQAAKNKTLPKTKDTVENEKIVAAITFVGIVEKSAAIKIDDATTFTTTSVILSACSPQACDSNYILTNLHYLSLPHRFEKNTD